MKRCRLSRKAMLHGMFWEHYRECYRLSAIGLGVEGVSSYFITYYGSGKIADHTMWDRLPQIIRDWADIMDLSPYDWTHADKVADDNVKNTRNLWLIAARERRSALTAWWKTFKRWPCIT